MSHRVSRRALFVSLALLLALSGLFRPQPAFAIDPMPDPLTGANGVSINPDGGGPGTDTGLRIDVYNTQYMVYRDGQYQVYYDSDPMDDSYNDWLLWLLPPDSTTYGGYVIEMLAEYNLGVPDFTSPNDYCFWSDENGACFTNTTPPTHTLEGPDTLGANKWRATVEMTGNDLYNLKLVYNYTAPNYYFDVEATVTRKPGNTYKPDAMHLYWIGDLTLNEEDDGPTTTANFQGRPTYGQFSEEADAFSGMSTVSGSEPDSVYLGYYYCAGDYNNADEGLAVDDIGYSGCSGTGPGNESKPAYGEPFSISMADYQSDFIDQDYALDAGMGLHWVLDPTKSSWKTKLRLIYGSYAWFTENVTLGLPDEETVGEEPAAATACTTAPTIRLVPDPLTIAPGETQTLWVEVVNSCRDKTFSGGDVLVSFDNGLSATAEGWLNLGQRIALQGISLNPAEMKSFPLFITAAPNATMPQHLVGEVYYAGGVAQRVDHSVVGLPAAVAPAAPTAAPEAAVPAVPAATPAPLPAALPNTGAPLPVAPALLALAGAAAALVGFSLRRRRA